MLAIWLDLASRNIFQNAKVIPKILDEMLCIRILVTFRIVGKTLMRFHFYFNFYFCRLKSGIEYTKLIEFDDNHGSNELINVEAFINSGKSFIYIMLPRLVDYMEEVFHSTDYDILVERLGK